MIQFLRKVFRREIEPQSIPKADFGLLRKIEILGRTKGYCYASNEYLADDMKVCARTIQRRLAILISMGYVVRTQRKRRRLLITEPGMASLPPLPVTVTTDVTPVSSRPRQKVGPYIRSKRISNLSFEQGPSLQPQAHGIPDERNTQTNGVEWTDADTAAWIRECEEDAAEQALRQAAGA